MFLETTFMLHIRCRLCCQESKLEDLMNQSEFEYWFGFVF